MEGGLRFKGITRAHYYELFMNENYDTPAVKALNSFLDTLSRDIRDELHYLSESEIKLALAQIAYSTLVSSIIMPGLFTDFSNLDLGGPKKREAYVNRLVESLLQAV